MRITELPRDELDQALEAALAAPNSRRASAAQVISFKRYLEQVGGDWRGWRGTGRASEAVVVLLLMPGKTGLVLIPGSLSAVGASVYPEALATVDAVARDAGLYYTQVLLSPVAEGWAAILDEAGYTRLTDLHYLERGLTYPWLDPPQPDEGEWVTYASAGPQRFGALVAATYEASGDCPELNGVRPMSDVLKSHQATGIFDPELWVIAQRGGEDVGCMLLAALTTEGVYEVAYMGVRRAARGTGIGRLLLRWALATARARRGRVLTLVVDERNEAARRLYERVGLRQIATRTAWWRRP